MRFAHGSFSNDFGCPLEPAVEYLRSQIGVEAPCLGLAMAIPVLPTNASRNPDALRFPEEIYGLGVIALEGRGWTIEGDKLSKLLEVLGKAEKDVIAVYPMDCYN